MAVIGLDLGATKLAGAVFQDDGKMLVKENCVIEKLEGIEVGNLITGVALKLLKQAEEEGAHVAAIGCCIPGLVYTGTGRVWAPNIPGWENYPLLDELRAAINNYSIKVFIDNDRACSILGELWQGSAKGCKDAIFLAVGTGIGAGILTEGRILRGSNDIAGAIGWLALDKPFQEKYTTCGCFEYHASGAGLARIAREYLAGAAGYDGILSRIQPEAITAHEVFEAFEQNDEIAVRVLKQAIEYWGMTVANLVSLFNPEKIIFGGGLFGPASKFLHEILAEARKWAQPISIRQVSVETSQLGCDAGLAGAAYLALTNQ